MERNRRVGSVMTRDEIMLLVNETAPRYESWGTTATPLIDKFSSAIAIPLFEDDDASI